MGSVDIVLSTYNGARYLEDQVRSIVGQTYTQWHLYIRDDSSTDQTQSVIESLVASEPRIEWIHDDQGNLGVIANFNCLLEKTRADYVFLCDQDDIWDADKIERSLKCVQDLEERHGRDLPILVHTDLVIVDDALQLISESFFEFRNLNASSVDLEELLAQNIVTGCTVLVNRALLLKALPIPSAATMHDSWLALVATAFGKIGFVDRATMLYRQHGSNAVGAQGWNYKFIVARMNKFRSRSYARRFLLPLMLQARAFYERYQKELPAKQGAGLREFASFDRVSGIGRVAAALRIGLAKHGWQRTLGFYWALLIARF